MGLLQIFDPVAQPTPIGIDLGTTNSLVAWVVGRAMGAPPRDEGWTGRVVGDAELDDSADSFWATVDAAFEQVAVAL